MNVIITYLEKRYAVLGTKKNKRFNVTVYVLYVLLNLKKYTLYVCLFKQKRFTVTGTVNFFII